MNLEEQVRAIVRDEIAKSRVDVKPEPSNEIEANPREPQYGMEGRHDPGEGWRIVDTEKEEWGPDVEWWSCHFGRWVSTHQKSNRFVKPRTYRRRIAPEPQYREPTNKDIGKMVEVRSKDTLKWRTRRFCAKLDRKQNGFSGLFLTLPANSCGIVLSWPYARIRCDGGQQ